MEIYDGEEERKDTIVYVPVLEENRRKSEENRRKSEG